MKKKHDFQLLSPPLPPPPSLSSLSPSLSLSLILSLSLSLSLPAHSVCLNVITLSQGQRPQPAITSNLGNMPSALKDLQDQNQRMSDRERSTLEEEHGWCPFNHSSNIVLMTNKPLTFYRKPVPQSTDAALSRNAYSQGVHLFEVTWPSSQRGSHPLVGENVCGVFRSFWCVCYFCESF